jgi:5-(aminomethyl)-3-furanmethanol phosphate kinase
VDAVIKVGGSLSEKSDVLKRLGETLCHIARKHRIVVVPGGGKFADAVRELDAKFQLPASVSHKMAILAMDQYGMLLSQVIPDASACESMAEAEEVSRMGKVAVFLPSKLFHRNDPFEPSWDVTSDSITAYVAVKLKAPKAIFVTDVDGVFTKDPKKHSDATLLKAASVSELLKLGERTSVDAFLPKFLAATALDCYVVNGHYPERVVAILSCTETVFTQILAGI